MTGQRRNEPRKRMMTMMKARVGMCGGGGCGGAVVLLLMLTAHTHASTSTPSGLEESPLTVVRGVAGGQVLLPCDVSPPDPSDVTILVLFYHGATGTPIYSIDGRNGSIKKASHWSDASLNNRAYFDLTSHATGLVLRTLNESDHAEYRCRVDFMASPTRNLRVQLNVVVPPNRIRILNEEGLEVSGVIGPYPVGSSLTLECQVHDGRPRPNVSWFYEESLLDDSVDKQDDQVTSNTLKLPTLTRQHLYRVLTCHASNSNLSAPMAATVTLDMSFPPLDVRILGAVSSLSEGERYALVCESSGSRPSASITWWKDGMIMTDTKSQIFNEGNVSRSTLYLIPTLADHNTYVSCRAKNPMVPTAVMEDSRKLSVLFRPRLSLAPGHNLDMEDIKEGDDVYFECGIQANPKVYKVQWFHNGEELTYNVSAGVIQSNQSLVLQQVVRGSSGQYTCTATNLQGVGNSNAIQLSVKFAPVCRGGQKVVYGGGKHEQLNITCSVQAHPEPTSFRWAFNSSSEVVDLPSSQFRVVGKGKSEAHYTPRTHLDYGSLLCWATNDVGRQQQPCIYHVVHAAVPDPVKNCSVANVSSTTVYITCRAGWDGGLSQTFILAITSPSSTSHDSKEASPRVLANTSTSKKPEFLLTGLQPGTGYVVTIQGVNKKGESRPVTMDIVTLNDIAQKRTSPGVGVLSLTPIVGVIVGVAVSVVVMAVVILLVVRSRRPSPQGRQEVKMVYDKGEGGATVPLTDQAAAGGTQGATSPVLGATAPTGGDEHNPDVIPVNDDHQVKEHPEDIPPTDQPPLHHSAPSSPTHQQQQQQEGSFYIKPGTLLNQRGVLVPRDGEGVLVGRPLAASTPATTHLPAQPMVYAYYVPENSPLLPKFTLKNSQFPKYPPDSSSLGHKYPPDMPSLVPRFPVDHSSPFKYLQDNSPIILNSYPLRPSLPSPSPNEHGSPLPRYPKLDASLPVHDLHMPHPSEQSYATPFLYPSLTLGRTGSVSSGRATPSSTTSTSASTHNGSTSTVALHPDRPLTPPRDVAGSPGHRESSV